MDNKIRFKELVFRADEKFNPRTLNIEYFEKHNLMSLWNEFILSTSNLDYLPISHRAKLYLDNIQELSPCYCGKHVTILDRKISKYCSRECGYKSKEKSEDTSKRMKDNATEYLVKRKLTMIKNYGHEFNFQRDSVKEKLSAPKIDIGKVEMLKDYAWCYQKYEVEKLSASDIGLMLNVYYGTVIWYLRRHGFEIRQYVNRSKEERQLQTWFEEEYPNLEVVYNQKINNIEYDIYIPSKNLAIEINGLYWHSNKAEDYHLNKSNNLVNIHLFHFTDLDIINKFDLVKSMIKIKLGEGNKIFARKCEIKIVSYADASKFEIENHIQGTAMSKHRYGLYHDDELVFLMTFGIPRFDKTSQWEIIRICSKQNTIVIGGASKLFKHFIRENSPKSIMSYCDIRFGTGNVYDKLGMIYKRNTNPGFAWVDAHGLKHISRFACQKKQMAKWLSTYDDSLSQAENMITAGYRKYYDCGNKVYEIEFSQL